MKPWNDLSPTERRWRALLAWGIVLPAVVAGTLAIATVAHMREAEIRALLGL